MDTTYVSLLVADHFLVSQPSGIPRFGAVYVGVILATA